MKDRRAALCELYSALTLFSTGEIDDVLSKAKVVAFQTGDVLFEELQRCDAFPFVLSGKLKVVKRSEMGREIALYEVAPGDACVVSSACLLGNKPYNAVGVVASDCELLMMPAEDFARLMSHEAFRESIFALFSKRVLELLLLVEEVAFRKLDQRLARLLVMRGPNLQVSHQSLADELGTVREVVTRTLNAFCDQNWVRLNRGSIEVVDPEGLGQLASN